MRVFISSLIFSFLFLTACTNPSKEIEIDRELTIVVPIDTSVSYREAITAPRYGCDGKILPQPKVVGMEERTVHIQSEKLIKVRESDFDKFLPSAHINGVVQQRDFQGGSHAKVLPIQAKYNLGWFPSWLTDILKVLFWIAVLGLALGLLGLLIWHLWHFFYNLRENSPAHTQPAPTAPGTGGNPAAVYITVGDDSMVTIYTGGATPQDVRVKKPDTPSVEEKPKEE